MGALFTGGRLVLGVLLLFAGTAGLAAGFGKPFFKTPLVMTAEEAAAEMNMTAEGHQRLQELWKSPLYVMYIVSTSEYRALHWPLERC